jgi:PKD repeat protein
MTVNPVLVPSVTIVDNPQGQQCAGTPITFTATPVNPGKNPTYQWQVNGTNVGASAPTYTYSTPADNDVVTVILTSNATCVSPATATSNSITLDILPTVVPTISFTADQTMPVCDGVAITYTATIAGGGPNPAYQWYVNGVAAPGATTPTFNNPATNNDIITVQLTSDAQCASPVTATSTPLTVQSQPFLTPSVSIVSNTSGTICVGQSVTFTATPVNGGASPSYQWIVNGNPVGPNSDTYTTTGILPGDVIECVLTSNYPCLNTPTASSNLITLQINPPITVTITTVPDIICAYETAVLTATAQGGDGGPYTYTWDNGDSGSTITVSPDFTQTYTVTATDQCGSTPATATSTVTVKITPVADFTFAPDSGLTTLDDINFNNNSFNASWWTWYFGDGTVLDTTDMPSHNYTLPDVYEVKLVVTSADGCVDSTTVKINIRDESLFYIPNAFTPDGNGLNELFRVYTWNIDVPIELVIYDRLGVEVYNSTEDNPNGGVYWTGQKHNQGDLLPDGVYVYYLYINAPYLDKTRRLTRGTVTMIR